MILKTELDLALPVGGGGGMKRRVATPSEESETTTFGSCPFRGICSMVVAIKKAPQIIFIIISSFCLRFKLSNNFEIQFYWLHYLSRKSLELVAT
ncbi:hypothetical protein LIER_21787 [Lithospermum erythrorhizon]|uniref:Uncharacterized protein n=1 Tax=Lithospermum erythrorhizon TaxID=34254 RepID=A0AAV3QUK4_LITER